MKNKRGVHPFHLTERSHVTQLQLEEGEQPAEGRTRSHVLKESLFCETRYVLVTSV